MIEDTVHSTTETHAVAPSFSTFLSSSVRSRTRWRIILPDLNFTVARAGITTSCSACGVAPDTRLCQSDFENAEIAQLDILSLGECFGNIIQGFLDDVENVLLNKPRLLADPHY